MTFPGGLQSHELRIVGEHRQRERLVVQTNHQRQLGSIVETIIDGHIQPTSSNAIGKIVEKHVRAGHLDGGTHHAVIKLFHPTKHGLQHLRASLVQTFVIHVGRRERGHDVKMAVRHGQCVQQHTSPTFGFQRSELLQQAPMGGFRIAHRKNRVSGMRSGHVGDIHDAHMAKEHAHGLVLVGDGLELCPQSGAERMRKRHHCKHV